MTDAQISLYAALRVAVPPGWRICGRSNRDGEQETQVLYFTRPKVGEFVVGVPVYTRDVEELALMVSRPMLENPRFTALVIWNVVQEAKMALATQEKVRLVRQLGSLLGAVR